MRIQQGTHALKNLAKRLQRRWLAQHINRASGVRFISIRGFILGGVHRYRDGRGFRRLLDATQCHQPVHARHGMVHKNHIGSLVAEIVKCRLARIDGIHRHSEAL